MKPIKNNGFEVLADGSYKTNSSYAELIFPLYNLKSLEVQYKIEGDSEKVVEDKDHATRRGISIYTNVVDTKNKYIFLNQTTTVSKEFITDKIKSTPEKRSMLGAMVVTNNEYNSTYQPCGKGAWMQDIIDIMDGKEHSFKIIRRGLFRYSIFSDGAYIMDAIDLDGTFPVGLCALSTRNIKATIKYKIEADWNYTKIATIIFIIVIIFKLFMRK